MRAFQFLEGQATRRVLLAMLATLLLVVGGCEMKSFLTPADALGRMDMTPVVLPILDQIDVIEDTSSEPAGLTQAQPDDLIPSVSEYSMSAGDLITVSVFELLVPGVESVQTRRIDELGMIRLPVVGPVKAEGLSPSQLEAKISQILIDKQVLKEPTVSVIVQESRGNTFSVIGEPVVSGTAIGTYNILGKNFRLMDAMALARGVNGQIKKLYIIRQAPLVDTRATATGANEPGPTSFEQLRSKQIEDLMKGVEPGGAPRPQTKPDQPVPGGLESGLDTAPQSRWINVDGKWVRADVPAAAPESGAATQPAEGPVIAQRIIEIPYDKLLDGDMRYNIIIRSGDVIRVPPPVIGNVYVGGQINRPGTYALPGDKDLTLSQLIFAAGNLTQIAVPERVDLTRRVGTNQQATIRLNLKEIFNGAQPDLFLKPNDTINIGTNFPAVPLAVFRQGFRASYGFGFVLDRNFAGDVFGADKQNGG